MAESKLVNNISIVESGTDGEWTYRKLSDGTAECWCMQHPSASIAITWGNGYISEMLSTALPTGLFIDLPCVSGATLSGYLADVFFFTSSKDSLSYQLFRTSSMGTSSITWNISIYAIGRWK